MKTKVDKLLSSGFTLVELLIVMAIIGILATIFLAGFRSSQRRARDAQRKSDLRQVANALEMFYSDYEFYPDASGHEIAACPFNPAAGTGTDCVWGTGDFTDGTTIYFRELPEDPTGQEYIYVASLDGQSFQMYSRLENPDDQNCIDGSCTAPSVPAYADNCGGDEEVICNFAVTSSNTTPTEDITIP